MKTAPAAVGPHEAAQNRRAGGGDGGKDAAIARALATRCAHGGAAYEGRLGNRPVQPPIVQSAIFDLGTSAEAEAIFSGARPGYAYSRFGNPSVDVLARLLADLEGGAEALVTSSGNSATLCAVTAWPLRT